MIDDSKAHPHHVDEPATAALKVMPASLSYDGNLDKFEFRLDAPVSIRWQISTLCNLQCEYCLSDSGPLGYYGPSTQTALEIIKGFSRAGVIRLNFTGGEPMMRRDLRELLAAARGHGIETILTTNAQLVNPAAVEFLREFCSLIQVSIDGPAEVHNAQRKGDVFKTALNAIVLLKEAGCNVRLISFLYRDNIDHLDYLLDLSESLNMPHLFLMFAPQGRGEGNEKQVIPPNEARRVKAKIATYRKLSGRYVRIYDHGAREYSSVLVTPDGDVVSQALHQRDYIYVGNMLKEDLGLLFNSSAFDHFGHIEHYLRKE